LRFRGTPPPVIAASYLQLYISARIKSLHL
jgi:hypothetical protein